MEACLARERFGAIRAHFLYTVSAAFVPALCAKYFGGFGAHFVPTLCAIYFGGFRAHFVCDLFRRLSCPLRVFKRIVVGSNGSGWSAPLGQIS